MCSGCDGVHASCQASVKALRGKCSREVAVLLHVQALVELLRKGKVESRLLDFFPPQKRTWDDFEEHFKVRINPQGTGSAHGLRVRPNFRG